MERRTLHAESPSPARRTGDPPQPTGCRGESPSLPTAYRCGGGHGGWRDSGYDCSGSLSYALHGGGLLSASLDSTGFMSWGKPGRGRWITVYANPGHAYMVVGGRRFDTTSRKQTGNRWTSEMRDPSGYVARHPAGL